MTYKEGSYDIVDGMIDTSREAVGMGVRSTAALAVPMLRNLVEVLKYPAIQFGAEKLREVDELRLKISKVIFDSSALKKTP